MPKHDSNNSSTQSSEPKPGSPGKTYNSGANVGSGKGPGPSEQAIAAGPKSGTKGR